MLYQGLNRDQYFRYLRNDGRYADYAYQIWTMD